MPLSASPPIRRGSWLCFPSTAYLHRASRLHDNMATSGFTAGRQSGRGEAWAGVRHPVDDGAGQLFTRINARPARSSAWACFYLRSDGPPDAALEDVLRFNQPDRFPALPGYKTLTSHWHWGYTIQALEPRRELGSFLQQVLKDIGIDAAITSDFHGDGHPKGFSLNTPGGVGRLLSDVRKHRIRSSS